MSVKAPRSDGPCRTSLTNVAIVQHCTHIQYHTCEAANWCEYLLCLSCTVYDPNCDLHLKGGGRGHKLAIFLIIIFMPDPSDLGCAVRSDGTLKDASKIEWHHDPDDELPMQPTAPAASTSSTPTLSVSIHLFFTGHPAPPSSRCSACTVRPSARVLDPNNAMNRPAASGSASKPPVANYKRKASPSPPSRRAVPKLDTISSDELEYKDNTSVARLSSPPRNSSDTGQIENRTSEYEDLQAMADADHWVCRMPYAIP